MTTDGSHYSSHYGLLRARSDDLVTAHVEDQIVLLDLRSAAYLRLNSSGVALWELLADGCTAGQMVEAVCSRYGVDRDRATADVEAFLEMLRARDLLDASPPAATTTD